jgi:sugar lactone lactonase YvrE
MQGSTHVGQSPSSVNWTDDSRFVYFRWLPAGHEWDAEQELYRVPAGGGEPELIDDPRVADSLAITFAGGDLSPDRRYRATSWRGDLYLVDRRSMEVRRLTDTRDNKANPRFSADGRTLFFTQSNQVYALDLATGTVRQLTDIRSGQAPPSRTPRASPPSCATSSWSSSSTSAASRPAAKPSGSWRSSAGRARSRPSSRVAWGTPAG